MILGSVRIHPVNEKYVIFTYGLGSHRGFCAVAAGSSRSRSGSTRRSRSPFAWIDMQHPVHNPYLSLSSPTRYIIYIYIYSVQYITNKALLFVTCSARETADHSNRSSGSSLL